MPSFCAVKNCEDKYAHSEAVSFHKFPLIRADLLAKWVSFADREPDWKPSKWSAICSRHFLPEDFRKVNSRKTLKKTAVPSVRMNDSANPVNKTCAGSHQDESKADSSCRLCGVCCRPVATFATNFEIFGMIQKCFPTLNFQLDDSLPKEMCSTCLNRLNDFSQFVDAVLDTQKIFQGKFRSEKFPKQPERQLKIKQEPVVNVKQEVAENFDSFLSDEMEEDQDFEQKFSSCDFPILNAQDIINNCDIMEIINLDDPFIDIPDDENGDEINRVENSFLLGNKSVHSFTSGVGSMIHEHNYALPIEYKQSQSPPREYKTEKEEFPTSSFPGTLFTEPPISVANLSIFNNSSTLNNALRISDSPHTNSEILMTSTADSMPVVEPNVKKPNIVVLQESIVKTAAAFQLYPCSLCQAQFFSAVGLSHHVTNVHTQPQPMVKLPLDFLFTTEKTEFQQKSYSCQRCGDIFQSIQHLLKHKFKVHQKMIRARGKQHFRCPMCAVLLMSKTSFMNHRLHTCKLGAPMVSTTPLKCRFCPREAFHYWKLYHMHQVLCKRLRQTKRKATKAKIQHSQDSPKPVSRSVTSENPQSATGEGILLCLGCNNKFTLVSQYDDHYVNNECKFKPSLKEVLAFCNLCKKPITSLVKLHSHRHFRIKKKYDCNQCSKTFPHAKALSQHRITHLNVRKHKCDLCNKIFKRRNGLLQHTRSIHYNMKPHECPVCNKRFALKADMVRCKHSILKSMPAIR